MNEEERGISEQHKVKQWRARVQDEEPVGDKEEE